MNQTQRAKLIVQTWQKAKIHAQASTVGIPSNIDNFNVCPCCDQVIDKQPLSMTQHTKQFEVFGFGYPLWFSFLKYCIFLILVLIASKTASQLYQATKQNYEFCYGGISESEHQNLNFPPTEHMLAVSYEKQHMIHKRHQANYHFYENQHIQLSQPQQPHKFPQRLTAPQSAEHHHPAQCTSFMVYFSLFKEQLFYEGTFLRIVQFLIHLVALIGIRNMILKEQQYYDERTTSLSDYSLIVSNLPHSTGNKQRIIQFLGSQFGMTYGYDTSQIREMIYIFKDDGLQEIHKRKTQLRTKMLKSITQGDSRLAKQFEEQIERTEIDEQRLIQKLGTEIRNDQVKCSKMMIVFNTQADKAQVLQDYKPYLSKASSHSSYFADPNPQDSRHPNQLKIVFKQAPQPNQIVWEHIDESDQARKFLILQGYALTFGFLVIITVIFYFIMLAKTKLFISAIQREHHDPGSSKMFKIFATIIVFVALFGVVFFNKFVMGLVLHKFVHKENHAFTDRQHHSFALKYAIGMFFTTAIMTLAVQAITFKNFYSHSFGVIEQQTIMFFVTAFLIPLIWFIHPYNLFRRFKHNKNKDKLVLQQHANELSEDFPYDLGKRYAEIFEIMWFTFLYSQLIPLGSFLILIGLVLYFWVDKFNFLRRSVIKAGISGKMTILALKSLDATLFLAPAGQILFDWILRGKFDILSIILTILGIIYLFIPVTKVLWYFNGQKFFLEQKPYEKTKYTFKETYYTLHPVYKYTHRSGLQKFKKKYNENLKEELKKIKMYGTGRGTYKTENTSSLERSTMRSKSKKVSGDYQNSLISKYQGGFQ